MALKGSRAMETLGTRGREPVRKTEKGIPMNEGEIGKRGGGSEEEARKGG